MRIVIKEVKSGVQNSFSIYIYTLLSKWRLITHFKNVLITLRWASNMLIFGLGCPSLNQSCHLVLHCRTRPLKLKFLASDKQTGTLTTPETQNSPTHNCYLVELYSVETHLSHTIPPLGFLSGDILLALVWYWGGSRLLLYTLSLWNKGFTHTHIHLSHHASIGISQWRHFISISVILRGV